MSLVESTAFEISRKVKNKEVSAVEVLDAHITQIEAVDGISGRLDGDNSSQTEKIHSFITKTYELAHKQAEKIDKMIASGQPTGLMAGVPVTIKDIFCLEGTYSTAASSILANFKAPYTATPVQRWLDEGAVVLGKVNLDEFTFGSSNESSAFKPHPRNPWDTTKVTGGSSGGSASSVAAFESPISLGTDTSGSIRQPASYCGTVGLKPTYGRVSRYGLIAFGSSLDCPGPLTRNSRDAALALQAMAGADPRDSTCATVPVPNYLQELDKDLRGVRIGLSPDYFKITIFDDKSASVVEHGLPDQIKNEVYRTAELLATNGAEIVEGVTMPHTRYGIPSYFVISRVEAASNLHRFDGVKYGHRSNTHYQGLAEMYRQSRGEGFGQQPKLRILMGMYVSAAQYSEQYYARALKIRSLIRRDFDDAFKKVDLLLTPCTPTSAFDIGGIYGDSVLMQYADQFVVPGNHAGIPGISLPAGFDGSNLPIAIQFYAPDYREDLLLRAGHTYEQITKDEAWRSAKPNFTGQD